LGVKVVEDVLEGVEVLSSGLELGIVIDLALEAVGGGDKFALGGVGFGSHGGRSFRDFGFG
jgi:hypothetical protein